MKKIIVIGAMEIETQGLELRLTAAKALRVGAFDAVSGCLGPADVTVCKCGIGKVHSAAATSALLSAALSTSLVLNLGVAGGVGQGVKQGDVVLGDKTVQHDFDQTPDGLPAGQVPGFSSPYFNADPAALTLMESVLARGGFSYHVGTIASGDQFICSKEKARQLAESFGAKACDMESAAIAQVCALYNVPFLSMRAVSDGGDDSAIDNFYDFVQKAAKRSIEAVTAFCKCL